MAGAVETLLKAAKNIDDSGSGSGGTKPAADAAAPATAAATAPKTPATGSWLAAYVDGLTLANLFATAAFMLTVSINVGIVYAGLGTIVNTSSLLMKAGAFLVALASAAPLVIMWNALEPGSTGWKTVGILVLASLQVAGMAGLLYGIIFLVRAFGIA